MFTTKHGVYARRRRARKFHVAYRTMSLASAEPQCALDPNLSVWGQIDGIHVQIQNLDWCIALHASMLPFLLPSSNPTYRKIFDANTQVLCLPPLGNIPGRASSWSTRNMRHVCSLELAIRCMALRALTSNDRQRRRLWPRIGLGVFLLWR